MLVSVFKYSQIKTDIDQRFFILPFFILKKKTYSLVILKSGTIIPKNPSKYVMLYYTLVQMMIRQ